VSSKLLVVDDDRYAREALVKVLENQGEYAVDTAEDGKQALEMAAANGYRLAILDYQLPDMTGAEILREVRATRPDFPAIFVTAYTTIDTVFPAVDAGAQRVLPKPFDAAELLQLVGELLGRQGHTA
jgi:DNA-binding response OmpR family regulator